MDIENLNDHVDRIANRVRLCAGTEGASSSVVHELEERIARRVAANHDLVAACLERAGLSQTERDVIWLLTAIALDGGTRALVASLEPTKQLDPGIDVIKRVIHGGGRSLTALSELGPHGALRRLGFIERCDDGGLETHESRQAWAVAPRVVALLHGDRSLDPSLHGIASIASDVRPLEVLAISEAAIVDAREAMRVENAIVIATGSPGLGKRSLLHAVAREAGIAILEIAGKRLSSDPAVLAKQLRLVARECNLLGVAPLIRDLDALVHGNDESCLDLVNTLAREVAVPVLATCGLQRPYTQWERTPVWIALRPPSSEQRAALWARELNTVASDGDYLATQYPIAPGLIQRAAAVTCARVGGRKIAPEDVYVGVRAVLDDRLSRFARRVDVSQTWDDLVLAEEQQQQIHYLVARIRQRRTVYEDWGFADKVGKGLGIAALFSGPPGTGKTMVAALVARELGLELYQVDIGKLVSKYIGETEKQLAELFDAAEAGHAILLFDEADSLFGKRTDVKSSNDRYANLETNYLLQRLESFTGICLLTSNHESNIDPAFARRLALHVRFELPEVDEREALWRATLPTAAPVSANLDLEGLARRFVMSGGYIRNAVVRAAFLAAEEGSEITCAHLEDAARAEYEGMGKIAVARSLTLVRR